MKRLITRLKQSHSRYGERGVRSPGRRVLQGIGILGMWVVGSSLAWGTEEPDPAWRVEWTEEERLFVYAMKEIPMQLKIWRDPRWQYSGRISLHQIGGHLTRPLALAENGNRFTFPKVDRGGLVETFHFFWNAPSLEAEMPFIVRIDGEREKEGVTEVLPVQWLFGYVFPAASPASFAEAQKRGIVCVLSPSLQSWRPWLEEEGFEVLDRVDVKAKKKPFLVLLESYAGELPAPNQAHARMVWKTHHKPYEPLTYRERREEGIWQFVVILPLAQHEPDHPVLRQQLDRWFTFILTEKLPEKSTP